MKKLLVPFLWCLTIAQLHCQTLPSEKELPPSGPMLARAPDLAKWNIAVKRLDSAKASATADSRSASRSKPGETVYAVTKTGSTYLQEHTDDLGRKWVIWTWNKISATVWPQTGAIILQCNIPGLIAPDYTKTDFPDVSWISESNFIKTTMYNGKKCLVFSQGAAVIDKTTAYSAGPKPRGAGGATAGADRPADASAQTTRPLVQTALVDYDTRVPIYAQDAKASYTFEYLQPPDAMLQIPPDIGKVAKQQTQVGADFARPIPRAF